MTQKPGTTKEKPKRDSISLHFAQPQLRSQELLAQGEEAAALLNSPTYNLAYRATIGSLKDQWAATAPHEEKKRESLYFKMMALSDVQHELARMVQASQALNLEEIKSEEINQQFE